MLKGVRGPRFTVFDVSPLLSGGHTQRVVAKGAATQRGAEGGTDDEGASMTQPLVIGSTQLLGVRFLGLNSENDAIILNVHGGQERDGTGRATSECVRESRRGNGSRLQCT